LDPEVSGKIAAGEVIERPVSVVKELLENALDASAQRITVTLSDGGKGSIRIEDNGVGISTDELPFAAENFTTSKISTVSDINDVRTLGFRGEALASIRAVSALTIRSLAEGESVGREMAWRGGELVADAPCARAQGTEILVENLFFNLPARRKFLSSGSSEMRRVQGLIQSYALAYPEVSFSLVHDGSRLVNYPAATREERVAAVFGHALMPALRRIDMALGDIRLSGYASLPATTRGNRYLQFFFVNGRIVKNRLLTHAVHLAYRSLIPQNRFPIFVLFIEIPPRDIDVNIHPAKAEIRFRNEREMHQTVTSAVSDALKVGADSFRAKVESVYRSIFPGSKQSGIAVAGENIVHERPQTAEEPPTPLESQTGWLFREAPMSLLASEGAGPAASAAGNLYWQLHNSFILIQIRGGLVIIDQHAAHERILFNLARRALDGAQSPVQSLLFPATLELSPDEYNRFEELADTLPALGFEVEPFGSRTVIVRGIPAGVRNWEDGKLLQEMLGDRETGRTDRESFLMTFACRAAVKAGTRLTAAEMESLTDQLFATEHPFTCPHGRPTLLRVDTAELERRFQRSVKPSP
jgi:DNA mismatch repair protein MutL